MDLQNTTLTKYIFQSYAGEKFSVVQKESEG